MCIGAFLFFKKPLLLQWHLEAFDHKLLETAVFSIKGNSNRRKYVSYLQKISEGRKTEHSPMQQTASICCAQTVCSEFGV